MLTTATLKTINTKWIFSEDSCCRKLRVKCVNSMEIMEMEVSPMAWSLHWFS